LEDEEEQPRYTRSDRTIQEHTRLIEELGQ
jgi:hypothetical protein